MTRNFAIIGVGGYIAPRHLAAIRDTGNILVAALDHHDSVGILDRFSLDVPFFVEFERFDRYAEKLRRMEEARRIHFVSICSPNYLHDAHVRFALRIGADAICEKPLVLNPWNLDALEVMEAETGRKIWTILQLRRHPAVRDLKARVDRAPAQKRFRVELSYVTPRGRWYHTSWKGQMEKSGGLGTNIGIHLFDMLLWIFGAPSALEVEGRDERRLSGTLELARADVRWSLSLDPRDVPAQARKLGRGSYRALSMDGEDVEFSDGFTELHTEVYRDILAGSGPGIADARPSIELAYRIRQAAVRG
jgi:UDP-N-acetyl-2-amino-2-deoxyglucuronate dehydrogenase